MFISFLGTMNAARFETSGSSVTRELRRTKGKLLGFVIINSILFVRLAYVEFFTPESVLMALACSGK